MPIGDSAGLKSVEEIDKVTIPELEAAAKRVIDYAFQRLNEMLSNIRLASGK